MEYTMAAADPMMDLIAQLSLTEISCAFIYFCLVERISNCVGEIPFLTSVPFFTTTVTSVLSMICFVTGWFALQMLMKTAFIYGFGMDATNVTIYVQPLAAFCLSIWHLEIALEEFWMPDRCPKSDFTGTLLSVFMVRGPISIMRTFAMLIGKLVRIFLTFPLKLAWGLTRLILSQLFSLFPCALLLLGAGMLGLTREPSFDFSVNDSINDNGRILFSVLSNLSALVLEKWPGF